MKRPSRRRLRHRLPEAVIAAGMGLLLAWTVVAQEPDAPEPAPAESEDEAVETAAEEPPAPPRVVHIRIDSAIHPVSAEFLIDSLQKADEIGATALVVELSTPGGLLSSTRDITKAMLTARTPVVVYVSPSGARAASAGFFILMAADVAAMAPGTNTGAAHPVGGQGEDIEGDMGKKVEEDAAATIRSLAKRQGRDVELAEAAVLESRSYTAEEALEFGLIDLIAPRVEDLLDQIDGREVEKIGEEKVVLRTADAELVELELPVLRRLLAAIARPEIAALLMALGMLGIYMELSNPGTFLPGIVGVICLIVGLYSMSVLPVNYAGVALVLLAFVLFIAETQVPSFGLLTLGGAVSLVLGMVMLFKHVEPPMRMATEVLVAIVVVVLAIVIPLSWRTVQVRRTKVTTGREGLVGEVGVARTDLDPRGKVFVHGELWNAVAEGSLGAGAAIEVAAVDGMLLHVKTPGAGSHTGEPAVRS
ncbi:MAG: nodulation protein NfeD [Thermoanaerobaculia bacterium]